MIVAKLSGQKIITVAPPGEGKNEKESLSWFSWGLKMLNLIVVTGWMEKKTSCYYYPGRFL